MKNLFRVLGLAVAILLVSLTAVQAYPIYDNCSYTCSDGNFYQTWATYQGCCTGSASELYCPPGTAPYPGTTWGGYNYQEQFCWY